MRKLGVRVLLLVIVGCGGGGKVGGNAGQNGAAGTGGANNSGGAMGQSGGSTVGDSGGAGGGGASSGGAGSGGSSGGGTTGSGGQSGSGGVNSGGFGGRGGQVAGSGGQGGVIGGSGGRGGQGGAGGQGAGGSGGTTTGPTMQLCQTLGLGFPHEISLSTDGTLIAVAANGGQVKILRASDGSDVRTLVAPGVALFAASFAPDGNSVVAGGQDGSLRRWSLPDGALTWTVPAAHATQIMSVRFAPGGATFASIANNGTGRLWRASDGGMVATFGHYKAGRTLAFSPDGQWLASGGERYVGGDIIDSAGQITLWRASDAQLVRSFNFTNLGGPPAAFAPDSRTMALVAGTVMKIVNVADGTDAMTFTSYPSGASRLLYTPDGATVVANGTGSISFWSVATGMRVRQVAFPNQFIEGLAITPDGTRVISALNSTTSGQAVVVTQLSDGAEVWRAPGFDIVASLSYSASGLLASAGYDTKVHLWNADGTHARDVVGGAFPSVAEFLGDGSTFAVSGAGMFVRTTSDGQVVTQIASGAGRISTSKDGTLLAAMMYPKTILTYTLPSLTAGPAFSDNATNVASVEVSPDGTSLASGAVDGELTVRSLAANPGTPLRFVAHAGGTYAIAYTSDGRTLATTGADGTVRLWQVTDGAPRGVFTSPAKPGYAVSFSPDGSWVAAGFSDSVVRIWRVADGAAATPLVGHTGSIGALAFSADGRRLATAGSDATIRVWCAP